MSMRVFTPATVVPQGTDGAVVYSTGALDSFGTDETPVGWPTASRVTAIEVKVTATNEFTADGQIQCVVCARDARRWVRTAKLVLLLDGAAARDTDLGSNG